MFWRKGATRNAGIDNFPVFTICRHTFATRMLRKTQNSLVVQNCWATNKKTTTATRNVLTATFEDSVGWIIRIAGAAQ